jgi:hypothetical protein
MQIDDCFIINVDSNLKMNSTDIDNNFEYDFSYVN